MQHLRLLRQLGGLPQLLLPADQRLGECDCMDQLVNRAEPRLRQEVYGHGRHDSIYCGLQGRRLPGARVHQSQQALRPFPLGSSKHNGCRGGFRSGARLVSY